jgi:hypothetical protein
VVCFSLRFLISLNWSITFKDMTEAGDIPRFNQSNNMCYNDISKSSIRGTKGSGRQIKVV